MYGLTDNIVAGPAGHTVAGPSGHVEAGPPGTFQPAPGSHVPVSGAGHIPYSGGGMVPYTEAGHVPITEGGHVPITEGGHVPITPPSGGITYGEGSTLSAIPGASAHVPVSGGGGGGSAGGGGAYSLGGAILGGLSSGGGGSGGGGGGGGAGGMSYTSTSGPGMAPMELRVGQAMGNATASPPTTPGTEGFTVTPGGRTVPTPTGYVHPPRASHFHGSPMTHVAHHPTRVENSHFTGEAWQPYKPSYVWAGRPEGSPPPPFLAGDYVKPSSFDPPKVLFTDEHHGPMAMVDQSIGAARMQVKNVENKGVTLDFSQQRDVEYAPQLNNVTNVSIDNSQERTVNVTNTERREVDNTLDFSSTRSTDLSVTEQRTAQVLVEEAARVVNLFFQEGQAGEAAARGQGGPVVQSKA